MKNLIFTFFLLILHPCIVVSQEIGKLNSEALLKELSEGGCSCVDSIDTYDKSNVEVAQEIGKCISEQTVAFQMGSKLLGLDSLVGKSDHAERGRQIDVSIDTDKDSDEYKRYYYELERYMMANCASLNEKIASNEQQSDKSFSKNKKAYNYYVKGVRASEVENFEKAVEYFEKAVEEDPEFAFAWDNLGLNYRRLNNLDKAMESYEKSLEIDPYGKMPLQNIAIVYQYREEYYKAIEAYERLASLDHGNPEVYYGIGNVYAINLKDYEKGLENMCKAYNIYVEQKSPYRTDAERVINVIYAEMKKLGKEEVFNMILESNNISQN